MSKHYTDPSGRIIRRGGQFQKNKSPHICHPPTDGRTLVKSIWECKTCYQYWILASYGSMGHPRWRKKRWPTFFRVDS